MTTILSTTKTALLSSAFIFLCACGPAKDGEDAGETTQVSAPTPSTPEPTMNSLSIEPSNNLESIYELTIDATPLIPQGERAYLSICDVDVTTTNVLSMNYDNCLLRSPVNKNIDTFSLSLPNHINKLVAIAWFYDLTKEPLIVQWDKSLADSMVWKLH